MKKSKVKICGLTNLADARFAAGAGAEYLGFIFVKGTPRYIEPVVVGAISEWVEGPSKVGVFQNQELSFVTETARMVGLDMIQLHGQESIEYCSLLSENHRIIKVFSVDEQTNSADLSRELQGYKNVCEYNQRDTNSMRGRNQSRMLDQNNPQELVSKCFLYSGLKKKIKLKNAYNSKIVLCLDAMCQNADFLHRILHRDIVVGGVARSVTGG